MFIICAAHIFYMFCITVIGGRGYNALCEFSLCVLLGFLFFFFFSSDSFHGEKKMYYHLLRPSTPSFDYLP